MKPANLPAKSNDGKKVASEDKSELFGKPQTTVNSEQRGLSALLFDDSPSDNSFSRSAYTATAYN